MEHFQVYYSNEIFILESFNAAGQNSNINMHAYGI